MSGSKVLKNKKEEDRFICMAKGVGLSMKQIAPHVRRSASSIYKIWKTLPDAHPGRKNSVYKKHKEIILVLLLANVDLFSLSAIFGYAPKVILRFVENECREYDLVCRPCTICGNFFIDFNNNWRCQSAVCKDEYRRQYKNRNRKRGRSN